MEEQAVARPRKRASHPLILNRGPPLIFGDYDSQGGL
jgi:hypothetical protein